MSAERQAPSPTSAPRAAGRARPGDYLPIAEHGIIGDLHTVALVGSDGTIDWFCPDRFDGPSVFGALLDRDRGGYYRIAPPDSARDEAALPTRHECPDHPLSLSRRGERGPGLHAGGRRPTAPHPKRGGVRGALRFASTVEPRFGYGLYEPEVTIEPRGAVFRAQGEPLRSALRSRSRQPLRAPAAEFELAAGERRTFVLQAGDEPVPLGAREAERWGIKR